ncbi:IclR family transcriptional regulator [Halodesulfurarchaeum formicicum]|uniref:IclR family transcriptional regulator n=1 Tax=Halodesulfurarchaeum formicicum TaxID=1873524 RepID=A0A1D8S263_9EURY|nr:IclR family transcriptional regulator [Halodesulfurarchaeum formicicum]AOW79423.1 IclR family transcriptional regulator [Halodesulfurarchaeum formicicum]APE94676.1 IclR family transcriptional regulator [Halodesulfurarchaeum formicicum]
MTDGSEYNRVKTTQLSIRILETIKELDGARLSEIVSSLDIAKSTAHKHLHTMEEAGYLIKEGGTYQIGLKFLNLGEYARERWPGFEHIKNAVGELTERTDEECDFVVEDHGRVTTIEESYHKWVKYEEPSDGPPSKEYRARIGSYYYIHATASGLAILAEYPTERVNEIINKWGLPAKTEYTITSQSALFEELEQVAKRGYSVDDQGYAEGMRSIGKAVHGPDGRVLGALSVSGPAYRVDGVVLQEKIPNELIAVVDSLEQTLAEEAPL